MQRTSGVWSPREDLEGGGGGGRVQGRGREEPGHSPWEFSVTAEVLVWRKKTKGKREKQGEVSRGQVLRTSALRTAILHLCNRY